MYTDIGFRNHQAVQTQGLKLTDKLRAVEETRLIGHEINHLLKNIETLFQAANLMARNK